MGRWKRVVGIGKRWCFWALLAALVAGGAGLLPPLQAVFLVSVILLFGVYCAFAGPSPVPGERPAGVDPGAEASGGREEGGKP